MNENIEKWVSALESGKYKQGRLVLRSDNDCFCALGVACDVLDPEDWESRIASYSAHEDAPDLRYYRHRADGGRLPGKVSTELFGGNYNYIGVFELTPALDKHLKSKSVSFHQHAVISSVASLNDYFKMPFPDLARVIRLIEKENAWK